MLVSDNKNISRAALCGFYMFLHSEALRHAQDISDIKVRMAEVIDRIGMTKEEQAAIEREALMYVKF
jgi:hypothetical protein